MGMPGREVALRELGLNIAVKNTCIICATPCMEGPWTGTR